MGDTLSLRNPSVSQLPERAILHLIDGLPTKAPVAGGNPPGSLVLLVIVGISRRRGAADHSRTEAQSRYEQQNEMMKFHGEALMS